jgi:hypothetical protein
MLVVRASEPPAGRSSREGTCEWESAAVRLDNNRSRLGRPGATGTQEGCVGTAGTLGGWVAKAGTLGGWAGTLGGNFGEP